MMKWQRYSGAGIRDMVLRTKSVESKYEKQGNEHEK